MLFPDLTISRYPLYHKQHRRHRQLYVTARDECTALISASKTDYFRNQLEKASNKNMFRLLRSLDGQRVQQPPEFRLDPQACELFSRFFRGKIFYIESNILLNYWWLRCILWWPGQLAIKQLLSSLARRARCLSLVLVLWTNLLIMHTCDDLAGWQSGTSANNGLVLDCPAWHIGHMR